MPVALHEHPLVPVDFPAGLNPGRTVMRGAFPMAGGPRIVTGRTAPITGDPDMVRAGTVALDHNFMARRRRRIAQIDVNIDLSLSTRRNDRGKSETAQDTGETQGARER
jgi:hypothetical protein